MNLRCSYNQTNKTVSRSGKQYEAALGLRSSYARRLKWYRSLNVHFCKYVAILHFTLSYVSNMAYCRG